MKDSWNQRIDFSVEYPSDIIIFLIKERVQSIAFTSAKIQQQKEEKKIHNQKPNLFPLLKHQPSPKRKNKNQFLTWY